MKLYESSVNEGLLDLVTFEDVEVSVLEILNVLYSSKQLNYIQTGGKEFPSFGPLESFSKKILRVVSGEVGWRCSL